MRKKSFIILNVEFKCFNMFLKQNPLPDSNLKFLETTLSLSFDRNYCSYGHTEFSKNSKSPSVLL